MSPLSAPVVGTSALLASPALYQGFVVETMPLQVVLERYAVILLVCWAALSLVGELVFSSTAHGSDPAAAEPDPAPAHDEHGDRPLAG